MLICQFYIDKKSSDSEVAVALVTCQPKNGSVFWFDFEENKMRTWIFIFLQKNWPILGVSLSLSISKGSLISETFPP